MLLRGATGHLKRRPDWSWCDSIHADAFWTQLFGKRFHEIHCCSLGLGVIVQIRCRVVSLFRSGRNDARARAQVWHGSLDNPEWRINIGLHSGIERLGCKLLNVFALLPPTRIGYQHVQAPVYRAPDKAESERGQSR